MASAIDEARTKTARQSFEKHNEFNVSGQAMGCAVRHIPRRQIDVALVSEGAGKWSGS
jgi:hypothetical protein